MVDDAIFSHTYRICPEHEQLVSHWKNIRWDLVQSSVERIHRVMSGSEKDDSTKARDLSGRIRKLHDLFGYMARGELDEGGLCRGAIYRTSKFINTPQESRKGRRHRLNSREVRVHIEHTVPVSVLAHGLIDKYNSQSELGCDEILRWILQNSITTAMLHSQGLTKSSDSVVRNGYSCRMPADEYSHAPFGRYDFASDVIINVFNGSCIDVTNYSLDDHCRVLCELLKFAPHEIQKALGVTESNSCGSKNA